MPISTLLPESPTTRSETVSGADGSELPTLAVSDLRVSVNNGRLDAVRGVSFEVRPGEAVGLVGESGSGKTLTCRAALGVLAPGCRIESGTIRLDGVDVTTASRKDRDRLWGSGIGAVFQDPASYLNPSVPVGRQLIEVLRVKLGLSGREARSRALSLFTSVGLHRPEHVLGQLPTELSGGMLQRVLLSIAIAAEPRLLIADEATTALDVTIQAEVLELIARLRRERELAVLFVSHDLAVVAEVCDQIVVFYAGEIVESGPTEQILRDPRHPYTRALLRVASVGDYSRRELDVIPGAPPSIGTVLPGCRFAPRCELATDACTAGPVGLVELDGASGRQSRCLRVADLAAVTA